MPQSVHVLGGKEEKNKPTKQTKKPKQTTKPDWSETEVTAIEKLNAQIGSTQHMPMYLLYIGTKVKRKTSTRSKKTALMMLSNSPVTEIYGN